MALQFIFGSSGAGKSHSLYQSIVKDALAHPEQTYFVIVPEQFTMQTQKDLVMAHPGHAILNIDVLSFGRLAYRVLEETGGNRKAVLDDEGKNLILRKIACDCEEELTVLKGNLKKQGYISEVKSVISEFTQYDIKEETMERMMKEAGEGSFLYYKLADIRNVYQKFYQYLEEKYITKEEILDLLCQKVKWSGILKNAVIALDGFTGFTPVQNRLMREFLKVCKEVRVTVTIPQEEDPYRYKGPYQLFAMSKEMTVKLLQICKEEKISVLDSVFLNGNPPFRFRKNPELAFLEKHLFRYHKQEFWREQQSVQIHCAIDPGKETAAVAGEIRRLVREEGYRYRDIAVIASDLETYMDHILASFERYGIPVFADYKRSILLNPCVEYVRSAIAMVQKKFTYESVFRFLRTNLTGFSFEEVDALENYVIALGIRGYRRWREKWVRKTRGMDEEELQRLNDLREAFAEKMEAFVTELRKPKKTVLDITKALYEFLVREDLAKKIRSQQQKFEQSGKTALAKEYDQIYKIMMELFDKFAALLGEEQVTVEEYCNLLDAGLQEAKVGVIPPGIDEVVAGDIERTRIKDVRAVFFLGANDTLLPGKMGAGGILSEYDREKLKGADIQLSPGGKEKTYIQKFYLYMNLTKPKDRLYVFFSKVSSEGKSLRPAYLIQDLRKMFPKMTVIQEEEKTIQETEFTEEIGISKWIQGLQEVRTMEESAWKELYAWYERDGKRRKIIEEVLDIRFGRKRKNQIQKQTAQLLYQSGINSGVTRLERYAACAFAHFMTYGLRLNERQEYEFRPLDWGNIFHRAMEHAAKRMQSMEMENGELPDDIRSRLADLCVEKSIVDYENTVLYSTKRREYLITRMKRLVDRTIWALLKQQKQGDFIQSGSEVRFEGGKIDRVDTCEDEEHVYVKVTDYKTGTKSFDITSFYYGIQLQLAVYMNAALEIEGKRHPGKEIIPAGIFYYKMQDPMVEKTDADKVEAAILKELRPDGLVNAEPEVIRHLDKSISGASFAAPFSINKDGSLSRTSKTASKEQFKMLSKYTQRKTRKLKEEILNGNTAPEPFEMGKETGCDYCPYKNICGFDEKLPECRYRPFFSMKQNEIFERIKKELDEEE